MGGVYFRGPLFSEAPICVKLKETHKSKVETMGP